ncbi:non-hydrolyzing UDP-N-acetylglucosamine 2-epimerase [Kutzneria albida]|uniref:UDP-N-acetylglucosamine 2-epimerase (non-hydrolyzing) n=1 Tax=Kutzneria albida DSM 43870 TaxID=1449976 RepID=W5WME7_9PSEU|nr:UDP-N-acetylglucosamine 2-epimerase (non-hydrolyzing) [Kutzneria albida]AHH99349.1 hypothetical protein KALB_5989 [Kutzneria albida DSM 43870]
MVVPEVLVVAGTRPEAIKVAPLAMRMARAGRLRPVLLAAGQHPRLVRESLAAFGLAPTVSVHLRRRSGTLAELAAEVVRELDAAMAARPPDAVVVQGDTSTAAMAAQVAFWRRIPVVHLEAGLRSHDLYSPFPEEANRKIIAQVAALHLTPTEEAARNLAAEGVAGSTVLTTGNTVVDAVLHVAANAPGCADPRVEAAVTRARAGQRRLVLVTAHRRESWGEPLEQVLAAVADLVAAHPDVEVVLPTHPNPAVSGLVHRVLDGLERVVLTAALPYPELARVLSAATLVLSDSGGIQEEAPSFQVPVLVLREVTERMEAVKAGCALLVGTDRELIVKTAGGLLREESARRAMTTVSSPFGDGLAADRAEQAIAWLLGCAPQRPAEFAATSGVPAGRPGGVR